MRISNVVIGTERSFPGWENFNAKVAKEVREVSQSEAIIAWIYFS